MHIPLQDLDAWQPELLVIGGGLAGHAAALEAAHAGAQVALLEKTGAVGGSTVQSSGSFAFAGTDAQREAGFEDSPENIRDDILSASGHLADPGLVDLFIRAQTDAYAWLRANGVVFHPVTLSSNQTVPRTHATRPRQLMEALHQRVLDNPRIAFVTEAGAIRLVTSPGGAVVGVIVEADGRPHELRSRCGVVLATGGFSRNARLIEKFAPRMVRALNLGGAGNTGDGLLMAWKLGADLVDMAYVNGTFGISLNHWPQLRDPTADEAILRLAIYRGGIAVNRKGERFADESISYKKLGELCLDQPDAVGFQLWDRDIMDLSVPAPTASDFEGALERGLVRQADTLASLAQAVGLDPAALEATVARYNADIDQTGADSVFGRSSLGRGWGKLAAIRKPPFYIYPCTTGVLATYCGLRVTPKMQCVDVFGQVIPGLYAAGEIVGGFHGSGYMSGSSLSKSVIFGREAARRALQA
jgi:fumarate reductase flavoprotein subunit